MSALMRVETEIASRSPWQVPGGGDVCREPRGVSRVRAGEGRDRREEQVPGRREQDKGWEGEETGLFGFVKTVPWDQIGKIRRKCKEESA